MQRFTTGFAVIVLILAGTTTLLATSEYAKIHIVELQTASADSSGDEFVELYNPNSQPIDLEGFMVQYQSASGSSWLKKAELSGLIEPRGRFLVGTYGVVSHVMSSGLAASGGHVRLYDPEAEAVHDLVGWGTAQQPEAAVVDAPDSGQSIKRHLDEDGYFIDTDDNSLDLFISESPRPQFDQATQDIVEVEEGEQDAEEEQVQDEDDEQASESDEEVEVEPDDPPSEEPSTPDEPTPIVEQTEYPGTFTITELFIDPEKPLTDAEDEFVEIANTGAAELSLEGYVIQTGNDYRYSFEIPIVTIQAGEHLAFYSKDTGLTLSNTAGRARLLDPAGEAVFETEAYENAKGSVSWALGGDGTWGWAATPTPDAANNSQLSATAVAARQVARAAVQSASTATAKKASASTKTATDSDEQSRQVYEEPEEEAVNKLNNRLLAGMGGLTVLYAGYEYRRDIGNRLYQLRRYVGGWRNTR